MLRFIRDNIFSFLAIIVFAGMSIAGSFWVVSNAIEERVNNRQDLVRNQARLSGNDLERTIAAFEEDFYYFILGTDSLVKHKTEADLIELKRKINNFLSHHSSIVDTVQIISEQERLVSYLSSQQGVELKFDSSAVPAYLTNLKKVDFQFIPEYQSLLYKHENTVYILSVNPSGFINERVGNFYLGAGGFKFVYDTHNGLTPFEVSEEIKGVDVSLMLDEATLNKIKEHTLEASVYSSMITVQINGNQHQLILEQHPFEVFDRKYALLFASDVQVERNAMSQTFFLVLGFGLVLTLLVVLVFMSNLQKLRKTKENLEQNKEELSKVIRQQKLLFEYSEDFTYRYNKQEEYDYVSENVERILGYTPDEFMRKENRRYTDNPINESAIRSKQLVQEHGKEQGAFYIEVLDANNLPVMLEVKEKPFTENGEQAGVIGIAKDVTDKFASDQKFRVLFEYSSDPYFIYTEEGVIDCNEAAVNALGVKNKDEILENSLGTYSPEKQPDGRLSSYKSQEMDNLAYEHGVHKFEWIHSKVNGETFPVEVTLTPVFLNNKRVMLAVWHDLTERKRIEQVLIESRKRAEDLASQKQQFLSSMSHEIRTPLNAVIGTTHFLLEDDPKPHQIEKLKTLKFSADNLLSLVNDILDHSKIESGKVVFNRERYDLHDRLIGVVEVMKVKAEQKNVGLSLDIDEKIPHNVIGDPVRLNQILLNIVSNAVKFTEKGSVGVSAKLLGKTDNHAEVEFKVSDTGIGIAEEKLDSIFETFTQANATILNSFGGTGLGLSITKKLIELQGGTIKVDSILNEGSTFTFKLSFKYENEVQGTINTSASITEEQYGIQGAKVLLVEDNPINQKIAGQFLNNWGGKVDFADNGRIALDMVSTKEYDFILMDIQMPEMDGYEATRAIRSIEDDYFKNIPIICLTADAFSEVRDRVLEAGMNDYVTKPINPKQFLKTIASYYKVKV